MTTETLVFSDVSFVNKAHVLKAHIKFTEKWLQKRGGSSRGKFYDWKHKNVKLNFCRGRYHKVKVLLCLRQIHKIVSSIPNSIQ